MLVIVVDMILQKAGVYRHLLFNRNISTVPPHTKQNPKTIELTTTSDKTKQEMEKMEKKSEQQRAPRKVTGSGMQLGQVWNLAVLLILFDVFLKFSILEKHLSFSTNSNSDYINGSLNSGSVTELELKLIGEPVKGYLHFLIICSAENLAYHTIINFLVLFISTLSHSYNSNSNNDTGSSNDNNNSGIGWKRVSTALVISSFAKLTLILMIIWDFGPSEWSLIIIEMFSLASNARALGVLLEHLMKWKEVRAWMCAVAVVCVGQCGRIAVQHLTDSWNIMNIQ